MRFARTAVEEGVALHLGPDPKLKTAIVKVFVLADLDAASATEIALLPSVLRRGTRAQPSQRALTRHLEALYGAQLGGDILKIGEEQVVSFKLEVAGDFFLPRGESAFAPAVETLRALLLDPALDANGLFPAPVVAQEKEKQAQFIDSLLNDKASYAAERCGREMCRGEPFEVYEYGSKEELARVTPASLAERWRQLIATARFAVFVLGAFDEEVARRVVGDAFRLGRKPLPALRGTTKNPVRRPHREIREPMSVKQGKLCIGLRSEVRIEDDGYFALIAMNGVLGAFAHSKLFRNVREKAGLCYYASSSIERTKGLVFIQSGVEKENYEQARDLSLAQLDAIRKGEITDEEIESTRRAMRLNYRSLLDKPAQLANSLYILQLAGRDMALDEIASRVESVTRDEMVAAANRIWLDTVYFLEPDGTAAEDDDSGSAEEAS